MATYSVNYWGSEPGTNDDCWCGWEFESLTEAEAKFNQVVTDADTAWVELDGPNVHKERRNPTYKPTPDNQDDWKREIAMQAGMGMGVESYNDYMGY